MLWRRLLVLLIGGVIAVPYIAVVIWVVTAWNQLTDRGAALGILATGTVTFVLLCVPAFLAVIRALERTLAEQLLGLTIPTPPRRASSADRLRGALFYAGHAFSGALLLVTVIVVIPSAVLLTADPHLVKSLSPGFIGTTGSDGSAPGGDVGAGSDGAMVILPAALIQVLAPLCLLLLVALIIAEGYFLPHYAQILLGPSAADRAALASAERVHRFRRTVLAREVHDSIGHALTVTTMQAAVAKRALHTDPTLAEAAVDEIAATGREAVAELDHVLALLRAETEGGDRGDGNDQAGSADGQGDGIEEGAVAGERPPRRTMRDIERLAEEARSLEHPTVLTVTGDAAALPEAVVGELHRIVREAVTNSLRHASEPGLSVTISVRDDAAWVETRNASTANGPALDRGHRDRRAPPDESVGRRGKMRSPGLGAVASARESRGLRGISERAELFGGHARWGVDDGQWILQVTLPFGEEAE